jgi:hypothetical protein
VSVPFFLTGSDIIVEGFVYAGSSKSAADNVANGVDYTLFVVGGGFRYKGILKDIGDIAKVTSTAKNTFDATLTGASASLLPVKTSSEEMVKSND